jgi:hypothetical protein
MAEVQTLFPIPAGLEAPIWGVAKLVILVGLLFYLVFAVVVIRQVQLMTKTVAGELDRTIRIVSWIHFALVVGVFLGVFLFL